MSWFHYIVSRNSQLKLVEFAFIPSNIVSIHFVCSFSIYIMLCGRTIVWRRWEERKRKRREWNKKCGKFNSYNFYRATSIFAKCTWFHTHIHTTSTTHNHLPASNTHTFINLIEGWFSRFYFSAFQLQPHSKSAISHFCKSNSIEYFYMWWECASILFVSPLKLYFFLIKIYLFFIIFMFRSSTWYRMCRWWYFFRSLVR